MAMLKSVSPFIVLYTTDVQQTHNFYSKVGAEIKKVEEDKVVVQFAGYDLHFILNTTEPFEAYYYIAEPGKYGQGVIFYVESNDIEHDQKLIEEAGGKIIAPVFENKWNAKEALFEDPNGYKFALWEMK